jgi:hypothetical protein
MFSFILPLVKFAHLGNSFHCHIEVCFYCHNLYTDSLSEMEDFDVTALRVCASQFIFIFVCGVVCLIHAL